MVRVIKSYESPYLSPTLYLFILNINIDGSLNCMSDWINDWDLVRGSIQFHLGIHIESLTIQPNHHIQRELFRWKTRTCFNRKRHICLSIFLVSTSSQCNNGCFWLIVVEMSRECCVSLLLLFGFCQKIYCQIMFFLS